MIGRRKISRAITTRYDKLTQTSLGSRHPTSIRDWGKFSHSAYLTLRR